MYVRSFGWTGLYWHGWWQSEPAWATLPLLIPALQLIVLPLLVSLPRLRVLASWSVPVSVAMSVWLGLLGAPVFSLSGLIVMPALQLMALPVAAGIWAARSQSWYLLALPGSAPVRLTRLAVLIAGRERQAQDEDGELGLDGEWQSHLQGVTGKGQQMRAACGFLRASLCYRWQDAAGLSWKLADGCLDLMDKVLASRPWSIAAVIFPPAALGAVLSWREHAHLHSVRWVTAYIAFPVLMAAFLLLSAIRLGRERRGAQPPRRTPRRGKQGER